MGWLDEDHQEEIWSVVSVHAERREEHTDRIEHGGTRDASASRDTHLNLRRTLFNVYDGLLLLLQER